MSSKLDALKADYPRIREAQRQHPVGAARLSAFSLLLDMLSRPSIKGATDADKQRAIDENGIFGALNWSAQWFNRRGAASLDDLLALDARARHHAQAIAQELTP